MTIYLDESAEFFLRVENHDVERRSRDVLAGPAHFYPVISGLRRVVFADDRTVFLILSLHFDSERA